MPFQIPWSKIVICGVLSTILGIGILEISRMRTKMTGLQRNFNAFASEYAEHPDERNKYRKRFETFAMKLDKKHQMEEEFAGLFERDINILGTDN